MEQASRRRKDKPEAAAAKPADTPPPKRRLSAVDRRREILSKSIEYFAKVGFDGGTRELARHLGTTQPLLYRYFPNKEALIQEIYKVVYLDLWKPAWDTLLTDSSRPLRSRLQDFYEAYTDAIHTAQWIRIYFFAGLKGVSINERYLALVEERILARIIREFHRERGLPVPDTIAPEDMEIAWHLQGGIFYYGVRKYVYRSRLHMPKTEMIRNALDVFFGGYEALLERRQRAAACATPPAAAKTRKRAAKTAGVAEAPARPADRPAPGVPSPAGERRPAAGGRRRIAAAS